MSDDAIVTREKVEEYLALTTEARAKATPCAQGSEDEARLESMMRMCDDYAADARHFMESGDLLRAFGPSTTLMHGLTPRFESVFWTATATTGCSLCPRGRTVAGNVPK